MAALSYYAFAAALITLGGALLAYLWFTVGRHKEAGRFATFFTYNGAFLLTASLGTRWAAAGHAPYSNQYEFATSFAWGTVATYLYIENRYRLKGLGVIAVGIAVAMLTYASTLPARIDPLIAALQNNLLLTVHVAMAIISYGAFAVAFAAGALYLVNRGDRHGFLPPRDILDEIGYKSVMVGFPAQTLLLILGAVWAHVAWGRYWGWDPKETAALFTWLIYGVYLHARAQRGWHGTRTAYLLLAGFGAVLFTFYGNYFLGGLHTYSGL
jgi:ABC-type transport system involved in cytochrome c biogenesis permease subunit